MYYLTAGESHGEKLVVIIEDIPSGISLTEKDINFELKRRSSGPGRSSRQDTEANTAKIISGVDNEKTTGNPVCVEVLNEFVDDNSSNNIVRPGHADLNGVIKHNFDDIKNVSERSSARETVGRVIAGTIAKNMLVNFDVEVYSYVSAIGGASIKEDETNMLSSLPNQAEIAMSEVMCPDQKTSKKMLDQIEKAKKTGDTLGGKFKVIAVGNVPGIGGYSQGKSRIDSKLAASIMSVPSVKSVSFGSSNLMAKNVGSVTVDGIVIDEFSKSLTRESNYGGGIEGGMTNGMPIVISCDVRPVPTLNKPVKTINLESMQLEFAQSNKRSDVCVVPNAAVISESEVAIVLATEYQNKFGHDSLSEIINSLQSYRQRIKQLC